MKTVTCLVAFLVLAAVAAFIWAASAKPNVSLKDKADQRNNAIAEVQALWK